MCKFLISVSCIFILLIPSGFSQTPGYRGKRFYVTGKLSGHLSIDKTREHPEEPWNFENWSFNQNKGISLSMQYGLNANYVLGKKSVFSLGYQFSRAGGLTVSNPDRSYPPYRGDYFFGRASFHLFTADLKLFLFRHTGIEAPLGVYFTGGLGALLGSAKFIYSGTREFLDIRPRILLPCIRPGIGLQRIIKHKLIFDTGVQVNIPLRYVPYGVFTGQDDEKYEIYRFGTLKNFFNFYLAAGFLIF